MQLQKPVQLTIDEHAAVQDRFNEIEGRELFERQMKWFI